MWKKWKWTYLNGQTLGFHRKLELTHDITDFENKWLNY